MSAVSAYGQPEPGGLKGLPGESLLTNTPRALYYKAQMLTSRA
jgi:hypothetical protein